MLIATIQILIQSLQEWIQNACIVCDVGRFSNHRLTQRQGSCINQNLIPSQNPLRGVWLCLNGIVQACPTHRPLVVIAMNLNILKSFLEDINNVCLVCGKEDAIIITRLKFFCCCIQILLYTNKLSMAHTISAAIMYSQTVCILLCWDGIKDRLHPSIEGNVLPVFVKIKVSE